MSHNLLKANSRSAARQRARVNASLLYLVCDMAPNGKLPRRSTGRTTSSSLLKREDSLRPSLALPRSADEGARARARILLQ